MIPQRTKAFDRLLGRPIAPGESIQVDMKVSETVSHEPGRIRTELMVSVPALAHDPARVARWLADVVTGADR